MLGLLAVAFAQDIVKYKTVGAAVHGVDSPSVTFTPQADGTFGFRIDCGVTSWSHPRGPLSAGQAITVTLKGLPKGTHDCAGTIDVDTADQTGSLTFRAPFASLEPLGWAATVEDVDLDARTARARTTRPLREGQASVIGTDGQTLATVPIDLTDPQTPRFTWSPTDEVLTLRITGTDVHGFMSEFLLSPWSYAIPHDDIVFATGQHAVQPSEVPKLEATWADIEATLKKYGDIVDIELFVAGFTDTVGDAAGNQGLSERRARALAEWFRGRGFHRPVHYQGFGEAVLAVQTADGTDEVRNRRALYLLSASRPATSPSLPRDAWRKLP